MKKRIGWLVVGLAAIFCMACGTPPPEDVSLQTDAVIRTPAPLELDEASPLQTRDAPSPSGGGDAVYDEEWPENEFTRQLPRPAFGGLRVSEIENGAVITFFAETNEKEALKSYVEELKAMGFAVESLTDEDVDEIFQYEAFLINADGYRVQVKKQGFLMVIVRKT